MEDNNYDETAHSRFNAGIAQTERIDALQRAINSAKFNPLQKNLETGTYNFEVIISSLDCMISEGWGKFNSKERETVLKLRGILYNRIKFFQPISIDKNGNVKVKKENYEKLLDLCNFCDLKIKELYDKHHLNAPSIDEDDNYDY